ncbi:hypothetical protein [Leptospira ainazelensis]|uniref:hypothetical protein n=1 Tax=Leptospira ainazelensis TaxID=2810034 RepID=UPI0019659E4C|nr:hypothetical protein [Leptospira ainazelensis]
MNQDILKYNNSLESKEERIICEILFQEIHLKFPKAENKIWHGHPEHILQIEYTNRCIFY